MKVYLVKRYLKTSVSLIVFIIFTLLVIMYLPCEIYNFQPPQKFSGNFLYNPYKDLSADWQKANFHAHSIAWNNVTNGKQPAQEIIDAYKQKGYDYSSVSNYEKIAKEDAEPNAVNVYEHGYSIHKVHQLVIMPQQVYYSDFPLWQFTSSKQFVINKLSNNAKAVAIAHPLLKHSYSDDDLRKMSGYNLMEVLNHSGNASCKWDVALSAGKPVWIIGDDDTHDILDTTQTFKNWTMINCAAQNKDSLIRHLVNGNAYAVNGANAFNDNKLTNVEVDGMQVLLRLQNKADSIKLIGQNAVVRKILYNADEMGYTFLSSDTYIRAVVYNRHSTMYFNPFVRCNTSKQPQNFLTATINTADTILYRTCLISCWLTLLTFLNLAEVKYTIGLLKNKRRKKKYALLNAE
ncbi:MAG: hypothetical protein ABJA35_07530 [Parafilimonas sp.]